ncbi:glycosyltransferase [Rhodopseudomonas palustris]|uniref:glycosyltransferase n=1 Tax=Rhodopseudomonas palustris TaxID=1076 RepID=UPI001A9EB352|nr:glycosyltransferase [Rhodopseudomonas palustris]
MLRDELSGDCRTPTEEEAGFFLLWAAINGRRRYHGIVIDSDFFRYLSEPAGRYLTRLELFAATVADKLSLPTPMLHEWYYEQGVPEFGLAPFVTHSEIRSFRALSEGVISPGECIGHATARVEAGEVIDVVEGFKAEQQAGNARIGVNLIGYAEGVFGIGEDIRCLAAVLRHADVPFCIYNVELSETRATSAPSALASLFVDRPVFPINVFCMTAFETERLRIERGADLFAHRYNIGYWPWELSTVPQYWRHAFDAMDEIWAISHFVARVFARATTRPVRFMPPYVGVEAVAPFARATANFSAADFVFLTMFDFNSYIARKNPLGAIAAFQAAFPDRFGNERLLIKSINGHVHPDAFHRVLARIGDDDRIALLDGPMSRAEVCGLIADIDCFVSLHRSEGFGRIIAEAMYLGTPVIATDYSGSTSFLDAATGFTVDYRLVEVESGAYIFSDGSQWAEPDLAGAVDHLRRVRSDGNAVLRKIEAARRQIVRLHGLDAVTAAVGARLDALRHELSAGQA